MSSTNNNNKECKHEVLTETDLSCTVCGMSRYDQLHNKKKNIQMNTEDDMAYIIKLFSPYVH